MNGGSAAPSSTGVDTKSSSRGKMRPMPNPQQRTTYSAAWRKAVRAGVERSARRIVPELIRRFHPTAVCDVGCGEGVFVSEFRRAGVPAVGVEGDWVQADVAVDLLTPPYPDLVECGAPFDMVLNLEVAEHVEARRESDLMDWLVELVAPTGVLVFSAAVPGQGGPGHVNEQWHPHWVGLLEQRGMLVTGGLRWELWDDEQIEPWYRQNLLVAVHAANYERISAAGFELGGTHAVVHPGMWKWKGHG